MCRHRTTDRKRTSRNRRSCWMGCTGNGYPRSRKKPRVLNLKELYPSLFGKKSPKHMTPEERRAAEIEAWTKFLMG